MKRKPKTLDLNTTIMIVSGVRYCLGRSSYVVSACGEWLWDHWEEIPQPQRWVILRDIVEAWQDGQMGMDMDKRSWEQVLRFGFEMEGREGMVWVEQAVAHRDKEYPFHLYPPRNGHDAEDVDE